MARLFNVNQPKSLGDWAGVYLFAFKELAVSAGFTVVGSGDGDARFAYDGVTSALPGAQQGSGGGFDCWLTGNTGRGSSTPAVAGDAGNAGAWCVVRDGAGREILLVQTTGTVGYEGYARIAVARAGSGGFVGAAVAPATIPAVPAGGAGDEQWFYGTRAAPLGVDVFMYNVAGYVHMWADDAPSADGGLPIGFFCVDASGVSRTAFAVIPTVANQSSEDVDLAFYLRDVGASGSYGAWDWAAGPTHTWRNLNPLSASSFWPAAGQADPITGASAIAAMMPVTSTNECAKGTPHPTSPRALPLPRAWGFYGVDQNGLAWCSALSGSWVIPWPDAVTVPLP